MPQKKTKVNDKVEKEPEKSPKSNEKMEHLNRMLAAVLEYISDDEVEVIDFEYLLNNTEGLREWWDQYQERNRQQIEDEIKKALGRLSLEELQTIRERINGK